MIEIAKIRSAGDKAVVQVQRDGDQVAEVVVEIHGGALKVFVHRWEGFDVPVNTHVV